MIRIERGPEPESLKRAAPRRLKAAIEAFHAHGGASGQLTAQLTGYGTRETKLALYEAQHEKCAWCEQRTAFSGAPIDHYRPKDGAWRHKRGAKTKRIDRGHYWWLTWSWSNLLFSCVRCNNREHKANYFPLRSRTRAATAPRRPIRGASAVLSSVSRERALLIDPSGPEDPLDHIEWRPTDTTLSRYDWTWTPFGRTEEGAATIWVLKLDELADEMQGHVRTRLLRTIEEVEAHIEAGRAARAHASWKYLLDNNLSPGSELSAFTWQALEFLVPARYRRAHGLAAPPRPGARR